MAAVLVVEVGPAASAMGLAVVNMWLVCYAGAAVSGIHGDCACRQWERQWQSSCFQCIMAVY